MPRISRKVIRKNYHGKANYEYVTLWLYIPKKFHGLLEPDTNQEVDIDMQKRNGKILIELTPQKSLGTRKNISFDRKPWLRP